MRASRETEILYNEDGRFIGVMMKADFTAEHEYGTDDLDRAFGINRKDESKIGLELRTVTEIPEKVVFETVGKTTYLVVRRWYSSSAKVSDNPELKFYKDDQRQTISAWSSGDFGIATRDKKVVKILEELHEAILNNDFAFWIGGAPQNPFDRGGLVLAIASRVPNEGKQTMLDSDIESRKLEEAVKRSGIREKLKEANCKYFALSPRFTKDGNLEFFLNPYEQRSNNSGWFNLKDLNNWTKGVGRIPK